VTDNVGEVVTRHDYYPFGEEIEPSIGRRMSVPGYGGMDGVKQKFTGYERDNETGLDFAQARYYGSMAGRFNSPDPLLSSATIYDPQSWNRYTYALNNSLKYIDPSGLYIFDASLGGELSDEELSKTKDGKKIVKKRNEFRQSFQAAKAIANSNALTETQKTAVLRAVNAYGTENDYNGVTVGVGKVAKGAEAETGFATPAFTYKENKFVGNITVVFRQGNPISTDTVAHESVHVADRQDLAGAYTNASVTNPSIGDEELNNLPENLTKYQTEFKAYQVSSYVNQARNEITQVWNSGWVQADREKAINNLLKSDKVYQLTPQNQGPKFIMSKSK
jgi:RHS repeat-associated protein